MAGGTWMNTGEGGLSPITSKAAQILFARLGLVYLALEQRMAHFPLKNSRKSEHEEVKAFELKLAQGAKHAAVILTAKR